MYLCKCERRYGSVLVCVCECVYLYVFVYVWMCICVYQCVCVNVYACVCVSAHTCVFNRIWFNVCMCVCVDVYMCDCLYCNTLQHTATRCNTLQHTATYCNTINCSRQEDRRVTAMCHAPPPHTNNPATSNLGVWSWIGYSFLTPPPAFPPSLVPFPYYLHHDSYYAWYDWFICVTRLIHMCDRTQS